MDNTKELPIDQIQLLANVINKQNKMSLKECLELYTKDLLLDLFMKNGYTLRKSWTKGKMIESLSSQILERFHIVIENADVRIVSGFFNMIPKFNKPVTKDEIQAAYFYAVNGFTYVLNNKEGQEILIIPKEIMEALILHLTYEDMVLISKREVLCRVLRGLSNIYGVYTREHLEVLLNKFENENEEFFANLELIDSCLTLANYTDLGYESVDGYIMNESLTDNESYKGLLETVEGKSYFIPSLKEVLFYAEYEFDMSLPVYEKLKEFLARHFNVSVPVAEDIIFNLSCVALNDSLPAEYLAILHEVKVVFANQKQVSTFLELVLELSNHTRKWSTRGFKPVELESSNESQTIHTPVVTTTKKVGRNDPCTCGSGKKYKKCCGR